MAPTAPTPPGWTPETYRLIDEGTEEDFQAHLQGILGINLSATQWARACALVEEGSVESLGQLGRHPLGLRTYYRFRKETLREYASMDNYMKHRVFGWPPTLDASGKKVVEKPADAAEQVVWRLNDFPYYLEEGIEHHNVWCTRPLPEPELRRVIADHRPAADGWEWRYFVNPAPLASIPTMWHAHVLSRRKP